MRSVQIAELKNSLSAYLHKVRAGEEIVIQDRKMPIAKIVPLSVCDFSLEEQALIAQGLLLPPRQRFDPKAFVAMGRGLRMRRVSRAVIHRALEAAREDADVSVLGHQRTPAPVRPRAIQPTR